MTDYVIGKLMGRCGNQFYQIATSYAYARKHGLAHFVTSNAQNCDNDAYYFKGIFPTMDFAPNSYEERRDHRGLAIYQEIPPMSNVILIGYWQCFDYFNEYREQLLDLFNLPYEMKSGVVSIHVRRGDFLKGENNECVLSLEYYKNCISNMYEKGYKDFRIYSDDLSWCKGVFTEYFYSDCVRFSFSEGKTELEDLAEMASCEHNILANSSFSFAASWFNRNPNKIVLCPDENHLFGGHNTSMIPNTYTKIYT
jgi:hypothetical protein